MALMFPTSKPWSQAAVGGQTATQVIQGEKLFDLGRAHAAAVPVERARHWHLLVGRCQGNRFRCANSPTIREGSGASFIYRENNSRYIGIQFSACRTGPGRHVKDGQKAVRKAVTLPVTAGLGRRIQLVSGSESPTMHHRTVDYFADLPDTVSRCTAISSFLSSSCWAWF